MKKAVSLMMAAAMTMGLAACGSSASTDTAAIRRGRRLQHRGRRRAPLTAPAADDGKVYNVGICQLVQHEALDAATQGFMDALNEELGDARERLRCRTPPAIPPTAPPSSTASSPTAWT